MLKVARARRRAGPPSPFLYTQTRAREILQIQVPEGATGAAIRRACRHALSSPDRPHEDNPCYNQTGAYLGPLDAAPRAGEPLIAFQMGNRPLG